MKLSDNFYLSEFLRSRTAIERDFKEQFNPPCHVHENLKNLIDNVLQPLRTRFNDYMYITSGYRCKRVNDAVGGVANSDHLTGRAADVTCKDLEAIWILAIEMQLPYKQMIWYKEKNIIHLSYDESDVKREYWIQ